MLQPRFLFFELNTRCHLRCRHCTFWANQDDDRETWLTAVRRTEILEELQELSPDANVVSCGGEPLLDPDDYFFLAREAQRLGLGFLSVTNGTLIRDDALADRLIAEGPTEITISLDHHTARVHDKARGTRGAFDAATGALRRLLAARARAGSSKPLYAMTIVCERNYRDLEALYDLVLNEIGADKLKLNILQPSFGLGRGKDKFYAKQLVRDVDGLIDVIRRCDRKYELHLDPEWIHQVEMYHRSIHAHGRQALRGWRGTARTSEHICNTYERNLMLDRYGFVRLCFSTAFPGRRLRERGDLRRFWDGADAIREAMRSCNRPCGISHSVRRVRATLRADR